MAQLKSRKRRNTRRRNTRRRVARRGGTESIKEIFMRVTGAKTSKQIKDWFNANATFTPKDLAGTDLEYFKQGSRMITFVVRDKKTKEEAELGFSSDY